MHVCNTMTRVCAIVGMGTILGIGHSMILQPAVGFGVIRPSAPAEGQTPVTNEHPVGIPVADPVNEPGIDQGTDPAQDSEIDPLDVQGPEGTITLREAMALHDDGAYFIDARHQEEFDEGRIPYALCLPAQKIRTKVGLDELSTIPPGVTIVIYCVGGECDASENTAAAIQRLNLGYDDIRILGRGFVDWVDAGLPVERIDGTIDGELP